MKHDLGSAATSCPAGISADTFEGAVLRDDDPVALGIEVVPMGA